MKTPLARKNLTHDQKCLALAVGGIGFAVLAPEDEIGGASVDGAQAHEQADAVRVLGCGRGAAAVLEVAAAAARGVERRAPAVAGGGRGRPGYPGALEQRVGQQRGRAPLVRAGGPGPGIIEGFTAEMTRLGGLDADADLSG